MSRRALFSLLGLALAACADPYPVEGARCPCIEGYTCCARLDRCLPADEACPSTDTATPATPRGPTTHAPEDPPPPNPRVVDPPPWAPDPDLGAVPSGFDFSTGRTVQVVVRTSRPERGTLEIVTVAGDHLYRGPLDANHGFDRRLALPRATEQLRLRWVRGSQVDEALVGVRTASVTHAF